MGPDVPHLNAVLQPKMEVGGREVNKYECHLCQVECNSIDIQDLRLGLRTRLRMRLGRHWIEKWLRLWFKAVQNVY